MHSNRQICPSVLFLPMFSRSLMSWTPDPLGIQVVTGNCTAVYGVVNIEVKQIVVRN